MSQPAIRQTIVDALAYANALEDMPRARLDAFVAGQDALPLTDLTLDSLARMELLIALEVEHGVSISPEALAGFASLEAVAAHIATTAANNGAVAPLAADGRPRDNLPPLLALFERAMRSCRTVNQINKLHIELDNRLTPSEFAQLESHARARAQTLPDDPLAAATTQWLDRTRRMLDRSGDTTIRHYTLSRPLPAVLFYRGPGAPDTKRLLIGFTSRGRRMLLPQSVFLQHLPADMFDVLIITDPRRSSLETGVPLLGDSVDAVIAWLAAQAWIRDYAGLRTLGCSGGGFPAVLAGHRLAAELAMSVGGRFPEGRHATRLGWTLRARHAAQPDSTRTVLAFGADKTRDRKFARALAWATGGQALPVTVPDGDVGHQVLGPLLERGELGAFLQATIGALPASLPTRFAATQSAGA